MEMVGVLMKIFSMVFFSAKVEGAYSKISELKFCKKNVTKKNNVRKTSDGRKRLVGGGKLDEFLALDE